MSFSLAAVCLAAMLASFWGTAKAPFQVRVETVLPFKEQMRIALRNRPFLLLTAGFFPQQIGVGCTLAMLPFYVEHVLKGSQTQLTFMFLCLMLPAVFFMPLWVLLSRRLGKRGSYLLSSLLFGLAVASMYFGSPERTGLLYLQMIVVGTAYAGIQLFPFSMLPDTIEVDAANSGLRREGIFTGAWTAQEKTGMAVGALLAGAVLSWSGFLETVAGQKAAQPDSALTGIMIGFALVPALLFLFSLPVIRRYDLSEERLKQIQAGVGS